MAVRRGFSGGHDPREQPRAPRSPRQASRSPRASSSPFRRSSPQLSPTGFEIFLLGATEHARILLMIPLSKKRLTVERHGELPFPEGTACAMVLIAGDKEARGAAGVRPESRRRDLHAARPRLTALGRTVFWSFFGRRKASMASSSRRCSSASAI